MSDRDPASRVRRHLAAVFGPGIGAVSGFSGVEQNREGRLAYVEKTLLEIDGRTSSRVMIHGEGPAHPNGASQSHPRWSPDGSQLALLTDVVRPGLKTPLIVGTSHPTPIVDGTVEELRWLDEERLALLVAGHGAQLSGVGGSGTVPPAHVRESWEPHVLRSGRAGDRRALFVWEPAAGTLVETPFAGNVWEFAVPTPDTVVAVISDGPSETEWYSAGVAELDLTTGAARLLKGSERQLGIPRCSPDGVRRTCVEGVASDRDLLAGRLWDLGGEHPTLIDTGDVDVTDATWLSAETAVITGVRRLDSVILTWAGGELTEIWAGRSLVEKDLHVAAAVGQEPVFVLDDHRTPQQLRRGGTVLVDTRHPGHSHVDHLQGPLRTLTWAGPGGLEIDGLLVTPGSQGPWPTVVHLHGGPVFAWRERWSMGYEWVPLLVEQGYAVFHPNVRGSWGRGFDFADAVHGDMGGDDLLDVTTAIDHLIATGVARADRIAVMGGSYGGYLAAALAVHEPRVAAALSFAPVTDWFSQHLTTNIPDWDERFLDGRWRDREGLYAARSPVFHVTSESAPTLFTTGIFDRCTPPGQALEMFEALSRAGVASECVVYPLSAHGLERGPEIVDTMERVLGWLDRFCPAAGSA